MSRKINGVIGLLLLLFSCEIGDETIPDMPPPAKVTANQASKSKESSAPQSGKIIRNLLPTQRGQEINSEAFLLAFKHQSKGVLQKCLEFSQQNAGSIGLSAVLDAGGNVRSLNVIDHGKQLPECAQSAIFAMNFKAVTASISQGSSVTVQWRLDW